ncbi:MAG: TldD/PmbA family protein [Planctomycetota bacterium]
MSVLDIIRPKVDSAELFSTTSDSLSVSFSAGMVKSVERHHNAGTGVRVLMDKKLGFASAIGPFEEKQLAQSVLDTAQFGEKVPFDFPQKTPVPEVNVFKEECLKETPESMIEMGKKIIEIVRKAEPDGNLEAGVSRAISTVTVENTYGVSLLYKKTFFSIGASLERVKTDDILIVYDSFTSLAPEGAEKKVADGIVRKVELSKRMAKVKSGRMQVLLPPEALLTLILPLMQGINGSLIAQGISPLLGREGEKLFDERFSMIDDGLFPNSPGSSPFDGEGVPCQRTVLIENGILRRFIFDLKNAALCNKTSTGNARRSAASIPTPGISTLVVQPGQTPLAEMIANMTEGIYVDSVLGHGQGNILSGAFSNSLGVAFKIENGEIVGRVKDVSIAGNVYEVLKNNIIAISKETDWVGGSLFFPNILVELPVIAK